MSDPTSAQEEAAADAMLDAQIDAHLHEKHEQRMRNEAAIPDDTAPDPEPPQRACEDEHDWRPIHEPGADFRCAKCGERNERDPEAFELTRQQRDVMGQNDDGAPNGQDYIEVRWVSQWERM